MIIEIKVLRPYSCVFQRLSFGICSIAPCFCSNYLWGWWWFRKNCCTSIMCFVILIGIMSLYNKFILWAAQPYINIALVLLKSCLIFFHCQCIIQTRLFCVKFLFARWICRQPQHNTQMFYFQPQHPLQLLNIRPNPCGWNLRKLNHWKTLTNRLKLKWH